MVSIQTVDAQALFTSRLTATFQERPKPTSFLRSFFPGTPPTDTLEIDILVQRGTERIAIDVLRGSDGNRNQMARSTEKKFIPPYFREYFDHTAMSAYETMFRGTQVSSAAFAALINNTADHVIMLREKIERSKELQAAKIFHDGKVPVKAGVNAGSTIDFKRKSASIVNLSATPWTTGATDVFAQIKTGCEWLRKNGRIQGHRFNMLCSDEAITALFANTTFLNRQNLFNMALDAVAPPQKNAVGGVYHGSLTAGPYMVDVWSYPEFYEDPDNSNAMTPYLTPKEITILPVNANFVTAHAMTPQLLEPGEQPVVGEYIISEFTDRKARVREFHVESAGLCIPVGVDQIYTAQVVA